MSFLTDLYWICFPDLDGVQDISSSTSRFRLGDSSDDEDSGPETVSVETQTEEKDAGEVEPVHPPRTLEECVRVLKSEVWNLDFI